MNLVTLLLVVVGAVQAIGLVAFLLGLVRAPEGFQDTDGFYLGAEPAQVLPTAVELEPSHAAETTPFGRAA